MKQKNACPRSRRAVPAGAFCLLLTVFFWLAGCAGETDPTAGEQGTMNIEVGENGTIRTGTQVETYQVAEGQRGIVSVRIAKVSGRLDLDIYPADGRDKAAYTGRDLDSASFEVILEEPGEYKVKLTAKSYVGDCEIRWRTEDTPGK